MDIMKWVHQLACAICHGSEKAEPQILPLAVTSEVADAEVKAAGLKLLYPVLLDGGQPYYFAKAEEWAALMDYIYFEVDMPSYLAARMDCEDFAILLKGLVSSFGGLNYFGVVFGNTPMGYHGWNILRTAEGLIQFEPQTGQFFPLGERGYVSEWALL